MFFLLRKIRRKLISTDLPAGKAGNKVTTYLLYAIGEIFLVVIGIMIALQFNSWEAAKIERNREVKYLKNITLDLEKDLVSLDYQINVRETRLIGDRKLINQINGAPIEDMTELTINVVNSLMAERFIPNNNTYSELISSGNLNVISNDSIKMLLMELKKLYQFNEFAIDHEAWDYQQYISKPIGSFLNIDKMYPVFLGEKTIEEQGVEIADFELLFDSKEYKNGLYLVSKMSEAFIPIYEGIQEKSKRIMEMIEEELDE